MRVLEQDGDVWDRALRSLDKGSLFLAEEHALKERLMKYIAERRALEAQGTVPRGVRRRGERLLEEVSAFMERQDRHAEASERSDAGPKGQGSRKPRRTPRADNGPLGHGDAPAAPGHPNTPRRRAERGRKR